MRVRRSWKAARGYSVSPSLGRSPASLVEQLRNALLITQNERQKMLQAHSIGPRMIAYLEEAGIERLSDLKGADAETVAMRIDVALGRRHINRLGIDALRNLIALAEAEAPTGDGEAHTKT